jgi:hypothetical protein
MKKQQKLVVGVASIVIAVVAVRADAQNMVVNGTFNGDISNWTDGVGQGSFIFDPLNYVGPGGSGSGLMTVTSTGSMWTGNATQCITGVSDIEVYDWGARVYIPSGHSTTGDAYIQLVWYASTDCSGTYLAAAPFTNQIPHTMTDVWAPTRQDDQTPPATAQSARIVLSLSKDSAAQPLSAHFDGVFFGPDPIPVELQGFTVD